MRAALVGLMAGAAGRGGGGVASDSIDAYESNLGACSGGAATTAAQVTVEWGFVAANPSIHSVQVKRNGTVVHGPVGASAGLASYVDTPIANYVDDGPYHRTTAAYTYVVELLLTADSSLVQSQSADPMILTLGACAP